MKRAAPYVILFLFAMLVWNAFSWSMWSPWSGMLFDLDGGAIGGPLDFLLAGGGTLLAVLVTIVVAVVLMVAFAGVGVILLGALGFAFVMAALAISPLLLPLATAVLLVWYLARRGRKESAVKEVTA